jgi:hypothetical protein
MANIILTEITIKMLLESGLITPGTILYSDTNPVKTATINSDGLISIDVDGNRKFFPYPSGAARALVNLSVNGWTFWKIKVNGELEKISHLRIIYKKQFQ